MSYAIDAGMDESPAIEVMMYRDKNGFFASKWHSLSCIK